MPNNKSYQKLPKTTKHYQKLPKASTIYRKTHDFRLPEVASGSFNTKKYQQLPTSFSDKYRLKPRCKHELYRSIVRRHFTASSWLCNEAVRNQQDDANEVRSRVSSFGIYHPMFLAAVWVFFGSHDNSVVAGC